MQHQSNDGPGDLDQDIVDVLVSRLDFQESPGDQATDESEEEELKAGPEPEGEVAVEWTPASPAPPASSVAPTPTVDSAPTSARADGPVATKVVRAATGNRTHAASQDEIEALATKHGLSLQVASQVANGTLSLQSAVNLRRMRSVRARREAARQTRGILENRRLLLMIAALAVAVMWALILK